MNALESANNVINLVRAKAGEVILFCSLGKDSLVLLDLMYPKFERVVCVFMYFVKDLDHINRYINWIKVRYPKVEFVQVPHWTLTRVLRTGLYCVANPKVRLLTIKDINANMQLRYGVDYSFYGMKRADSLNRRLMLNTYQGNNYEQSGNVYPLADWTQRDILAYMKMHKLPAPVRYSKNASGGIGFNIECFLWMRENAPADLQRVLRTFPMSEKILYDYDNRQK